MLISDCSSMRERREIGMTLKTFVISQREMKYTPTRNASNGRLFSKFINPPHAFISILNEFVFIIFHTLQLVEGCPCWWRVLETATQQTRNEWTMMNGSWKSRLDHNSAFSKALLINLYLNSHSRVPSRGREISRWNYFTAHSFLLRTFFMLPHHPQRIRAVSRIGFARRSGGGGGEIGCVR